MSDTVIQLKFSEGTATPTSLNVAEPAYSNTSNKLFLGLAGNQVVAVGGKYYTDIVDAATDANTASKLVKRDTNGDFSAGIITATLNGNATTATTWQNARNIGLTGDATGNVSVNGSADKAIPITLASTGVSAGSYGGSTNVATFVVDAKGRITSAGNTAFTSNDSYSRDTANSASSYANGAFVAANTANTNAISAGSYANSAYIHANAAFSLANSASAGSVDSSARSFANSASSYANSAFQSANSAGVYANAAFSAANTAQSTASGKLSSVQSDTAPKLGGELDVNGYAIAGGSYSGNRLTLPAGFGPTLAANYEGYVNLSVSTDNSTFRTWKFDSASGGNIVFPDSTIQLTAFRGYGIDNTARTTANSASSYANGAFITANSASSYANGAFVAANTADQKAVSAGSYANSSFVSANSASSYANGAFVAANTADQKAVSAGDYANSAYTKANTAAVNALSSYGIANSGSSYANSAFETANSAGSYANAAFTRANTKFNSSGGTISGDVTITGNLILSGNTFTSNVTNLNITDSMIFLAANNDVSDSIDIGFVGHYKSGSANLHTGFVRHAADSKYYLFDSYVPDPYTNVIDVANSRIATISANLTGGIISGLAAAISVSEGGTGNTSFAAGNLIVGNGSGNLVSLANTGTAGTYGSASYIPVVTTDAWGRVSSVSNTQIAIDTSRIISGTLGVVRGGTGNSSFAIKGVIVSDTTSSTGALSAVTSSTDGDLLQVDATGVPYFGRLRTVSGGSF